MITEELIFQALKSVQDPDLHKDIVSLGFVKDIVIDGGKVAFKIELTTPACPVKDLLKQQSHDAVAKISGVTSVEIIMTSRIPANKGSMNQSNLLPGVKNVIAVASGKGGVGKSTVATNLAVALGMLGAKVGLLDADIYGPSIPLMMGTSEKPGSTDGQRMDPILHHGIQMMSIGFLMPEEQALVWRGPMVAQALTQLMRDVAWGELDYLIVDMPPGTGDVSLTLSQLLGLAGAVVV
ncbi:MAG TPA: P-loop NTPase, partial [bacterium]|nr:P-loop NTPase [bacterium]